jgi:hypothetical protein
LTKNGRTKRNTCAAADSLALKINGTKQIFMGLVLAAAFMAPDRMLAAGPAPIDLKIGCPFHDSCHHHDHDNRRGHH